MVVRRGQIWRIGWVIKTLEAQVGQFCSFGTLPFRGKKKLAARVSMLLKSRASLDML